MKRYSPNTLFLLLSCVLFEVSYAQQTPTDNSSLLVVDEDEEQQYVFPVDPLKGFYDQNRQGWFSFENPNLIKKPEDEKQDPASGNQSPAKAPPFTAKWFRENMQVLQDKAIDEPTEKNVRIYLIANRIMLDKAEKFAEVGSRISFGDPLIDEGRRRSNSSPGMVSMDYKARENIKQLLNRISVNSGLYFFTKAGCSACIKQQKLLESLSRKHGITFIPVSLDGSELDTANYLIDSGQARSMGVDQAPSLVFYNSRYDYYRTLSQSAITYRVLTERILLAALDGKVISEREFAMTRNIKTDEDLSLALQGSTIDPVNNPDAFLLQFTDGYRPSSNTYVPVPSKE